MSTINETAVLRFYLDTQEYSDRLTTIEAQAASTLATQKSEVAAAIAQVNLTQSQAITALTLEVSNLRTDLTDSITATETNLINRADQLAQDVTDITNQLTQDKATFTQEIQDALDCLKDDASAASALRTPRKIQGVDFDGTQDISLPTFSTQIDGLVPKRIGATADNYLREDGTWVVPTDTTYALLTEIAAEEGTATTANTISAQVLRAAIHYHAPPVTDIGGNAKTATKLQAYRTINGTTFNGTASIITENWGKARLLTIGLAAKYVNGSAEVSWSLAEIGAAAANHTHAYLPTSGGTLSGNLSVTGTITATDSITAFSDARLKDNITKIPDALNKLNQLKGVTYTRKDLATNTQYAGLIAQDVQKVLPEAVVVTEDDIIAVNYNGIIGLLVEAIKELETKVAILEGR